MLILGDFIASAKLLHTIPLSGVLGVSSINNEIFVLVNTEQAGRPNYDYAITRNNRAGSCGRQSLTVVVYNASTFVAERSLPLSDTQRGFYYRSSDMIPVDRDVFSEYDSYNLCGDTATPVLGFTACSHNKCLYIFIQGNSVVNRMPVRADTQIGRSSGIFSDVEEVFSEYESYNLCGTRWSVDCQPFGLSINKRHNVIIACGNEQMFLEYTTDGGLIQKVTLHPDIESPVQVVQLIDGHYGVIYQGSSPGYSVVDTDGNVIKRYDGDSGVIRPGRRRQKWSSKTAVLSVPCALTVVSARTVVIACQNNNKLLALTENGNAFTATWWPEAVHGALNQPQHLHFDVSKKKLYVSERGGYRVLCYGM